MEVGHQAILGAWEIRNPKVVESRRPRNEVRNRRCGTRLWFKNSHVSGRQYTSAPPYAFPLCVKSEMSLLDTRRSHR